MDKYFCYVARLNSGCLYKKTLMRGVFFKMYFQSKILINDENAFFNVKFSQPFIPQ